MGFWELRLARSGSKAAGLLVVKPPLVSRLANINMINCFFRSITFQISFIFF